MSIVQKLTNTFDKTASKLLKPLDNKLIGTTARVALILYASLIAPELPESIARHLDNIMVRAVLIFLIAYMSLKDPITAALATLALMVTVMSLHRRDVQGVLGGAGNLVGGAIDKVEDVVGGAMDTVEDVLGGAASLVGLGSKPMAKEAAGEAMAAAAAPAGMESGMDDAGML